MQLEEEAIFTFRKKIKTEGAVHFEKLFEHLSCVASKGTVKHFKKYTASQKHQFFKTKSKMFNTENPGYVSLQKKRLHRSKSEPYFKLSSAVTFLLKCFDKLPHFNVKKIISYAFDDILDYFETQHEEFWENVPGVTIDKNECLRLEDVSTHIDVNHITADEKLLLLTICYVDVKGEIYFDDLTSELSQLAPTGLSPKFYNLSDFELLNYLDGYSEYLQVRNDGYIALHEEFVSFSGDKIPEDRSRASSKKKRSYKKADRSHSRSKSEGRDKLVREEINLSTLYLLSCFRGFHYEDICHVISSVSENTKSYLLALSGRKKLTFFSNIPNTIIGEDGYLELLKTCQIKPQSLPMLKMRLLFFVSHLSFDGPTHFQKLINKFEASVPHLSSKSLTNMPASEQFRFFKSCAPLMQISDDGHVSLSSEIENTAMGARPKSPRISADNDASKSESSEKQKESCDRQKLSSVQVVSEDAICKKVQLSIDYLLKFFKVKSDPRFFRLLLHVFKSVKKHFFSLSIPQQKDLLRKCFLPFRITEKGYFVRVSDQNDSSCLSEKNKELLFFSFSLNHSGQTHYRKLFETFSKLHEDCSDYVLSDADKFQYFKKFARYFTIDSDGYVQLPTLPSIELGYDFFSAVYASDCELYLSDASGDELQSIATISNYKKFESSVQFSSSILNSSIKDTPHVISSSQKTVGCQVESAENLKSSRKNQADRSVIQKKRLIFKALSGIANITSLQKKTGISTNTEKQKNEVLVEPSYPNDVLNPSQEEADNSVRHQSPLLQNPITNSFDIGNSIPTPEELASNPKSENGIQYDNMCHMTTIQSSSLNTLEKSRSKDEISKVYIKPSSFPSSNKLINFKRGLREDESKLISRHKHIIERVRCAFLFLKKYFEIKLSYGFWQILFHVLKDTKAIVKLRRQQAFEVLERCFIFFTCDGRDSLSLHPFCKNESSSDLSRDEEDELFAAYALVQFNMRTPSISMPYVQMLDIFTKHGRPLPMRLFEQTGLFKLKDNKNLEFKDMHSLFCPVFCLGNCDLKQYEMNHGELIPNIFYAFMIENCGELFGHEVDLGERFSTEIKMALTDGYKMSVLTNMLMDCLSKRKTDLKSCPPKLSSDLISEKKCVEESVSKLSKTDSAQIDLRETKQRVLEELKSHFQTKDNLKYASMQNQILFQVRGAFKFLVKYFAEFHLQMNALYVVFHALPDIRHQFFSLPANYQKSLTKRILEPFEFDSKKMAPHNFSEEEVTMLFITYLLSDSERMNYHRIFVKLDEHSLRMSGISTKIGEHKFFLERSEQFHLEEGFVSLNDFPPPEFFLGSSRKNFSVNEISRLAVSSEAVSQLAVSKKFCSTLSNSGKDDSVRSNFNLIANAVMVYMREKTILDVARSLPKKLRDAVNFLLSCFSLSANVIPFQASLYILDYCKIFPKLPFERQAEILKESFSFFNVDSMKDLVPSPLNNSWEESELSGLEKELLIISAFLCNDKALHFKNLFKMVAEAVSGKKNIISEDCGKIKYFHEKKHLFSVDASGFVKLRSMPNSLRTNYDVLLRFDAAFVPLKHVKNSTIDDVNQNESSQILAGSAIPDSLLDSFLTESRSEMQVELFKMVKSALDFFPEHTETFSSYVSKQTTTEKLAKKTSVGLSYLSEYFGIGIEENLVYLVVHSLEDVRESFKKFPISSQIDLVLTCIQTANTDPCLSTNDELNVMLSDEEKDSLLLTYVLYRIKSPLSYLELYEAVETYDAGFNAITSNFNLCEFLSQRKDVFSISWLNGVTLQPLPKVSAPTVESEYTFLGTDCIDTDAVYKEITFKNAHDSNFFKQITPDNGSVLLWAKMEEAVHLLSQIKWLSNKQIVQVLFHSMADLQNHILNKDSIPAFDFARIYHIVITCQKELSSTIQSANGLSVDEKDVLLVAGILLKSGAMHYAAIFKELSSYGREISKLPEKVWCKYLKSKKIFAIDSRGYISLNEEPVILSLTTVSDELSQTDFREMLKESSPVEPTLTRSKKARRKKIKKPKGSPHSSSEMHKRHPFNFNLSEAEVSVVKTDNITNTNGTNISNDRNVKTDILTNTNETNTSPDITNDSSSEGPFVIMTNNGKSEEHSSRKTDTFSNTTRKNMSHDNEKTGFIQSIDVSDTHSEFFALETNGKTAPVSDVSFSGHLRRRSLDSSLCDDLEQLPERFEDMIDSYTQSNRVETPDSLGDSTLVNAHHGTVSDATSRSKKPNRKSTKSKGLTKGRSSSMVEKTSSKKKPKAKDISDKSSKLSPDQMQVRKERTIKFVSTILSFNKVGLSLEFLRHHFEIASKEIKDYLEVNYNGSILKFILEHPDLYFVSHITGNVYLRSQ